MTILCIGAHPDDIEVGCGGTILKLSKKGINVNALVLTNGERGGQKKKRMGETRRSLEMLGVNKIVFGNFKDTEISISTEIMECIEEYIRDTNVKTIFTHSLHDTHQDHYYTAKNSLIAGRKISNILKYETKYSTDFHPLYYVDIREEIQRKISAIDLHESQVNEGKLKSSDYLLIARYRGRNIGIEYAEAFEVERILERIY